MSEDSSGGVTISFDGTEIKIIEGVCGADGNPKLHKRIAVELGIPLGTVNWKVKEIATKIPGNARPSMRIHHFFWHTLQGSTEALQSLQSVDESKEEPGT